MARFRLRCKSVFQVLLFLTCTMICKVKRVWNWLILHQYSLGLTASFLLLILNIVVFRHSCKDMEAYYNPVKLQHGFAPVFPHHFFHGPDLKNTNDAFVPSLQEPEKVDLYLHSNVLHNSLSLKIPPVIHIVWCDYGPFTFSHYLPVLAAFKAASPSVLYLHLLHEPDLDPDGYYQFLPDLRRDIPPLVTKKLTSTNICYGSAEEKLSEFMKLLGSTGGFVINGRTMLVPTPSLTTIAESKISIASLGDKASEPLVLTAGVNVLKEFLTKGRLAAVHAFQTAKHYQCQSVRTFEFLPEQPCLYIHEDIYPVMIFNSSAHSDHFARWIAYGTSKRLISQPADTVIVPNIVHYVWLGKRKLEFFGYLSLLSSLFVLKADVVYIHGNFKPEGDLWREMEQHPRVRFIHRDFPNSVYGEAVKNYPSHASDYLRADVLLRYGGVYADWDVIFLQEMPNAVRRHSTTANVDWPETGAFPDVFNLGVLVAAPGAPFLRHFLESYRWYLDRHWSYNAIHMPFKVYEKQPCSLNVDRHLQILCALNKCHATWLHDYKDTSLDHLNSQDLNWKTDAMAIHWTHPDPVEFKNKDDLFASHSVTARIGQFVLSRANISP